MANSAQRLPLVIWWVIRGGCENATSRMSYKSHEARVLTKYRTPPDSGYKFLDTTVVANSSGRLLLPALRMRSTSFTFTEVATYEVPVVWDFSGDIVDPTVQKPAQVGP